MPRRRAELAHLVTHLTTLSPRLAPKARDDVPSVANVLEPREEDFDPLRRNLDDVVHAGLRLALLRRFALS
jgi:hypothetical protein